MCSTPGMFSTPGVIIEYTGGCSVHWGITLSTPGGVEYTGGIMSTLRDTVMSVGDIMSTPGDVQYIAVFIQIQLCSQRPSPTFIMISPLYS